MRRLWVFVAAISAAISLRGQGPSFSVSPASLSFGNVVIGSPATQIFTIIPESSGGLSFFITSNNPAFFVSPSGIPQTTAQQTVSVTFTPSAATAYTGQISVLGAAPSGGSITRTVDVSGTGVAAFTVSPTSLSFGTVLLSCPSAQSILITPSALLDFALDSSSTAYSANPSSFSTPNARTVTVTFTPNIAGSTPGSITVAASQGGRDAGRIPVSVSGTGADLAVSSASLDFGSVRLGGAPATQTVRVTRGPSFPISTSSSNPAFTVSPVSSSGDATVTFSPTTSGATTGTITFTVSDPANASCTLTRSISVRGFGVTVDVAVNPISLDFGGLQVGMTSAPRTVTLSNNSNTAFNGTATSNAAAFTVRPTSYNLDAGASQTFEIDFSPRTAGLQTARVVFSLTGREASSITTTVNLSLQGQGLRPADLTASPERLDFGDVAVGSPVARTVTVANPGGIQSDVTATATSPFSLSPTAFALSPGGSRGVNVTFAPTSAASFEGTATFTSGAITRTVALTGRGIVPNLSFGVLTGTDVNPVVPGDSITVEGTPIGTTRAVRFQITNNGSVSTTFSRISSSGPAFSITGLPALPFPLAPGAALSFLIQFQPNSPGPAAGTLNIDGREFGLTSRGLITGVTIRGVGRSVDPAQQPVVGVVLSRSYPVALSGRLHLEFQANARGGDDPAIQFATSGRTVEFTIPENSTEALFGAANEIAYQSGTVAGDINFRAELNLSGNDVTPSPEPSGTVTVARSKPVVQRATASRTSTGIQVTITGFATTREVNRVDVEFVAAPGANLGTSRVPIDVTELFNRWYTSQESAPFGSLFTLTIPFTAQGDPAAAQSVGVTLSNGDGDSQRVEATIPR